MNEPTPLQKKLNELGQTFDQIPSVAERVNQKINNIPQPAPNPHKHLRRFLSHPATKKLTSLAASIIFLFLIIFSLTNYSDNLALAQVADAAKNISCTHFTIDRIENDQPKSLEYWIDLDKQIMLQKTESDGLLEYQRIDGDSLLAQTYNFETHRYKHQYIDPPELIRYYIPQYNMLDYILGWFCPADPDPRFLHNWEKSTSKNPHRSAYTINCYLIGNENMTLTLEVDNQTHRPLELIADMPGMFSHLKFDYPESIPLTFPEIGGDFLTAIPENPQPKQPALAFALDQKNHYGRFFFTTDRQIKDNPYMDLKPLATVLGRFLDPNNSPAANLQTQIFIESPSPRGPTVALHHQPWKTIVNPDGKFTITSLPYHLKLKLIASNPNGYTSISLDKIEPGLTKKLGDITLKPLPVSTDENQKAKNISGLITDHNAKPIPDLIFQLSDGSKIIKSTTNKKGQFNFDNITPATPLLLKANSPDLPKINILLPPEIKTTIHIKIFPPTYFKL